LEFKKRELELRLKEDRERFENLENELSGFRQLQEQVQALNKKLGLS